VRFPYSRPSVATTPLPTVPQDFSQQATSRPDVLKRHSVRVIGHGKPPLLLCNGFGCTQGIWRYLTSALAVHHQVILFDYVGSGQSDLTAYDSQKYATLHGYAQDVVEICQALALEEVTIVGHSEGALVALLATIAAAHYFTRAVLIAVSPFHLNQPGYYGGFDEGDLRELLAAARANYWHWATGLAFLLMGDGQAARLGHELATQFCQADFAVAQQAAYVTFLSDHRADLPRVSVPTHLLQCADDIAVPAEVNAYLLAHLPQATLTLLPTTGHCPHLSAPQHVLAALQHVLGLTD
jgi:sigma-B regulation protein RsbQ